MEVHKVIRQGISSASWGRRLAVAVALAGLLSAIPFVAGGPEPAQARGDDNSDCVTVPLGSKGRAICTYLRPPLRCPPDPIPTIEGNGAGGVDKA
jgi:hypothetical protein